MSAIFQASREHLTYYWLAYCYGFLFSLNALVTAIIASFMNTEWGTLTPTKKFLLICVILANWTGTMIAFLNRTLSRLRDGLPPIQTGDTSAFVKTETTIKTTP